jgi:AcrR family transcriptional regulator
MTKSGVALKALVPSNVKPSVIRNSWRRACNVLAHTVFIMSRCVKFVHKPNSPKRYFYESFKNSEALLVAVYQDIIKEMQNKIIHTILAATNKEPKALIKTGLTTFLSYIREDVRVARILFIDVPHVRFENTVLIRDTLSSFNTLLQHFGQLLFPNAINSPLNFDLITAGLNGANVHIVTYWIHNDFAQPFDEVLESCYTLFAAMADYLAQAESST